MKARLLGVGAVLLAVSAAGCALTSKSDPLVPRYFDPDLSSMAVRSAAETDAGSPRNAPALRLGRVTAAAHLGERIVYRSGAREIGFYEERRWTATPDWYLREALSSVLFEREGIRRVVGGGGVTLEVELTHFEELRGPTPMAHARAKFLMHDGKSVLRERAIDVGRPIAGGDARTGAPAEAAVQALSLALADLVNKIAAAVVIELAKSPSRAEEPASPTSPANATSPASPTHPGAIGPSLDVHH